MRRFDFRTISKPGTGGLETSGMVPVDEISGDNVMLGSYVVVVEAVVEGEVTGVAIVEGIRVVGGVAVVEGTRVVVGVVVVGGIGEVSCKSVAVVASEIALELKIATL